MHWTLSTSPISAVTISPLTFFAHTELFAVLHKYQDISNYSFFLLLCSFILSSSLQLNIISSDTDHVSSPAETKLFSNSLPRLLWLICNKNPIMILWQHTPFIFEIISAYISVSLFLYGSHHLIPKHVRGIQWRSKGWMNKYIISELGFKKIRKIVTCASGRKVVPGTDTPWAHK